jgi:hypothetical protein
MEESGATVRAPATAPVTVNKAMVDSKEVERGATFDLAAQVRYGEGHPGGVPSPHFSASLQLPSSVLHVILLACGPRKPQSNTGSVPAMPPLSCARWLPLLIYLRVRSA